MKPPKSIELTDSAQAAEAARRTIEEGVDGIKIYASRPAVSESVIRAVVEEAHRAKRPVFVHCNTAEDIQNVVYEIGRHEPFLDHKKSGKDGRPGVSLDWFNMLYQVLLGQEKGPRFGSFVAVYGLKNTVDMIDGALARSA